MDPRRRPDDHLVEPLFAAFHRGEAEPGRRGVALRRAIVLALTAAAIALAWTLLVSVADPVAAALSAR